MIALEYGTYIIDITGAMLEHRGRIDAEYADFIDTMRRRSQQFVTEYICYQGADVQLFLSYLNHDAVSPVAIVIGFCELIQLDGDCMPKPFLDAIGEVLQCAYAIHEEIELLKHQILDMMEMMEVEYTSPRMGTPLGTEGLPFQATELSM